MLDSTLWLERECRDLFITALLMAEPREFSEEQRQIAIGSLETTGWVVPAGWYGFVAAAGPGIVNRAGMDMAAGMAALKQLGEADPESRSADFEGRRLVRVDGGFIVLNYIKYREKDATSAERSKRWRERHKAKESIQPTRVADTPTRVIRHQEEVEVEVEVKRKAKALASRLPKNWSPSQAQLDWALKAQPTWDEQHVAKVAESFRDYWLSRPGQGATKLDWDLTWHNWVRRESPRKSRTDGQRLNLDGTPKLAI